MSQSYIGQIRLLAFNFAPSGHALCSGQLLPISNYSALFNVLGNTFGGDGQTTFALPDLRGRTPVHIGTARSGSNYSLGAPGGQETVSLGAAQMPSHGHVFLATTNAATSATPRTGLLPGAVGGDTFYAPVSGSTAASLGAGAVLVNGGATPHDNMMPSLVINASIALVGVYPSQN